jgi:hypothetical protein
MAPPWSRQPVTAILEFCRIDVSVDEGDGAGLFVELAVDDALGSFVFHVFLLPITPPTTAATMMMTAAIAAPTHNQRLDLRGLAGAVATSGPNLSLDLHPLPSSVPDHPPFELTKILLPSPSRW